MSSRALLRVKRRRSEDPFEALMISCQPKRARGSRPLSLHGPTTAETSIRSAGGDYEGAAWSDRAPPLPVVSKVFHLAGTVGSTAAAAKDEARIIEEIRVKGKPSARPNVVTSKGTKASKESNKSRRSENSFDGSRSSSMSNNVRDDDDGESGAGEDRNRAAFKAVLKKRKLGGSGDDEDAVFDVVKADVREEEEDDLDAEFRVGVGSHEVVACNDVPMTLKDVGGSDRGVEEFVYDLYYTTEEGANGNLDLSFLDAYLDVQPYRNEDLDALENYGFVEPASMLQRGFLGVEDEDSNDENNWRNDYPDSDSEDNFDREEPDYDQCGFDNDATRDDDGDDGDDDDDERGSPVGVVRDHPLSEMLRIRMKLKGGDGEEKEEEEEDDNEEENRWDHGNPIECRPYLDFKKRTMAQMGMRDDDDEDEDEDEDSGASSDGFNEGRGAVRCGEKLNYFAYDERLDKDSESDSFDKYSEDGDDLAS